MNILDHILAGHYPTDDKGRALVPMDNGATATICATDMPGQFGPITGWWDGKTGGVQTHSWRPDGGPHCRLLPPPHRKVTVVAYAVVAPGEGIRHLVRSNVTPHLHGSHQALQDGEFVVELTGEYEETWK